MLQPRYNSPMDGTWAELITGVLGAILGWFSKHFTTPRN